MGYKDQSGRMVPHEGKNGAVFVMLVDSNGNPVDPGGGGGGGGGLAPDATTAVLSFAAPGDTSQVDASGYGSGTIQIIKAGGSLVVEGSNDGAAWTSLPLMPIGSTGNQADLTTQVSATGMWRFDTICRYVRVRASAITAGPVRAIVNLTAAGQGPRSVYINGMAGNLFTGVKLAVAATDSASQIATVYRLGSAAASNNAALVKSGATRALTVRAFNASDAVAYLKLFNKNSAPAPGTDTPLITIPLPPGQATDWSMAPYGLHFAAGIGVAITKGAADNDNTPVAAGDVTGLSVVYA